MTTTTKSDTIKKKLAQMKQEGFELGQPRKLTAEVEAIVWKIRTERRWGAVRIQRALEAEHGVKLSLSVVSRSLREPHYQTQEYYEKKNAKNGT